jgi:hypothetical protein
MIKLILNLIAQFLGIYNKWPEMRLQSHKKKYNKWRSHIEARKNSRRSTARSLDIDKLSEPKSKLP